MALAGVKVLDFTRFQNGPFATCLMSDVGATVVKVEQPGIGDTGRGFISSRDGLSGYNESINRGKRSVELDIRNPGTRPVLERLIRWADVLTENFKPGVLDRLGYGYEYCRKLNPKLIYCTNSGFGPTGPWANRGSFDIVCQGMSGAMVASGGGPSQTPVACEWGLADQVGALNFAFHIAAALVARDRTGEGQKLECSQLGAMVQFQSIAALPSWYNGAQRDDDTPNGKYNPMLSYYQCGDKKWLVVAPAMEDRHFNNFCKAVGLDDMLRDKKFNTHVGRHRNNKEFRERLERNFLSGPRDKWVDLCVTADVPVGPVLNYEEVKNHPQMRANGYVTEYEHEAYGRVVAPGVAASYSSTRPPALTSAPDLGEHTAQVLQELCGLSKEEVQQLSASHVTTPDPATGYRQPFWFERTKRKPQTSKL